jgi:hypothetical protein
LGAALSKFVVKKVWDKKSAKFRAVDSSDQQPEFIKGPIPVWWLSRMLETRSAAACGIGLQLWFLKGVRGSSTVTLSNARLGVWKLNRFQKSRALRQLAEAGLIVINEQRSGRSPTVTIVERLDSGEGPISGT